MDGELANTAITATSSSATTSPAILDTLPLTEYQMFNVTSDSRFYTVPSAGTNKLFVVLIASGNIAPSATLNGQPLTIAPVSGMGDRDYYYVGTLGGVHEQVTQIWLMYSAN